MTCCGPSSSSVDTSSSFIVRTISVRRIVDRLVDAAPAAGHEAVEVRAADEREARAERDRRHDVGARHDARVEVHLEVGADLAHDVAAAGGTGSARGRAGGRRGSRARCRRRRGRRACFASSTVCTPLTTILPGHISRMTSRSSNEIVGSIAESSSSPTVPPVERERRELERRGGEEVDPPCRPGDRVDDGAGRELRRDREAVALVAQARAGDGRVDREEEGVEAGGCRAAGELVRDLAVAHHVELEPVAAVRVRGLHVLDRGRAERREGERDAGSARGAGAGDLALGLHQAGEARSARCRTAARSGRRAPRGVVSTTGTLRRIDGWNSMSWNAWRARASDSSPSAAPSV